MPGFPPPAGPWSGPGGAFHHSSQVPTGANFAGHTPTTTMTTTTTPNTANTSNSSANSMSETDPAKHAYLLAVDTGLRMRAAEWTEYRTPDGKSYFFSVKSQQSVWDKPDVLKELDGIQLILLLIV